MADKKMMSLEQIKNVSVLYTIRARVVQFEDELEVKPKKSSKKHKTSQRER